MQTGSWRNPDRLLTGFYDPQSGARLATPAGEDYVRVATIRVLDD